MILVIETATAACSVALIGDEGVVVAAAHEEVGRGHAERLLPMIASLPDGGRADGIAVDCGPGSFTGVRVGLAAARALSFAWGVPVSGYSSLALIAAEGMADADALTVAIIGGHGELFVQRFRRPLAEAGPLRSLRPEDAARDADPLVIGSGAELLVAVRGSGEARALLPRAAAFALLPPALAGLPPVPIYGRAPDAKVAQT
jgi:tRNA threonylcarbamoyladenosine biosynthesis protein TsaB